MEVVSPLVRSIFEGRKKMILDAGQKVISKKGGCIHSQTTQKNREHVGAESEKATLNKKVQALDEEIAIFKKESKRVKNLAKVNKLVLFELPAKVYGRHSHFLTELLNFFEKIDEIELREQFLSCKISHTHDLHQILVSLISSPDSNSFSCSDVQH